MSEEKGDRKPGWKFEALRANIGVVRDRPKKEGEYRKRDVEAVISAIQNLPKSQRRGHILQTMLRLHNACGATHDWHRFRILEAKMESNLNYTEDFSKARWSSGNSVLDLIKFYVNVQGILWDERWTEALKKPVARKKSTGKTKILSDKPRPPHTPEAQSAVQELVEKLFDAKKIDRKGIMLAALKRHLGTLNNESKDKDEKKAYKRTERKLGNHQKQIDEGRRGFSALKLMEFYASELNVPLSLTDKDNISGKQRGSQSKKRQTKKKETSKQDKDAEFATKVWRAVKMGSALARAQLNGEGASGLSDPDATD